MNSCLIRSHFRIWMTLALFSMSAWSSAQSASQLIKSGNKDYSTKKWSDAEVNYKKSLEKEKDNAVGRYNLGNAYYKQDHFEQSSREYQQLIDRKDVSDDQKAAAYHNLGNSLLQDKKYDESIQAFKQSLKLNPKDNDTRYNLAYAQSMLRQQNQQKQQQNDKKDDKNQDQKQNQQNQDKQKEEQQKSQDQSAQNKEQKGDEKQKGASGKDKISKEDAEKILQALNNDEKNLQKKLNKKEGDRVSIDKNW